MAVFHRGRLRSSGRKPVSRAMVGTILGALVLSACGGGGSTAASGEQLIIVTGAQTNSFAQDVNGTGYENAEFLLNSNATLLRNPYVDGDGEMSRHQDLYAFEGLLADSYEVSDDGLVYTFRLSESALSQAGNTLTADDVLYSYERKFAVPTSIVPFVSAPAIVDPARQIRKIDDHTVTFTVDAASHGFTLLSLLSNTTATIYDSKVLKEHASDSDPYAAQWSSTNGNWGFGAYKLDTFKPGQEMIYTANPGYVGGEPEVKRIVQRVVQDPGTRANLLRNGDANIAAQLRPADQADLTTDPNVELYTAPTNAMSYIPLTTTTAPFDNVAVRRAFAYAIPYDKIIEDTYRGRAGEIAGILSPDAPGYDGEGLAPFTYDPAKSKEILAAAGITSPVAFTLTVNSSTPDLQEAATQIQTAAAAAGFTITIDPVPSATYNEGLAAKTFQASMGRDYSVVKSPPYELLLFYTAGSPLNWPNWENAAFYAAVNAGIAAGDPLSPEAGVHWNAAQRLIQEEVPTVWMNSVQPLNAFRSDVDGYVFRTDNVIDYSELSFE
ncbi:MAG: ABC transporter substrate-binding protein [Rhodococcus sp. (in: high G+C Gram-positive bacteria)]|uniref:ABC transporter substrate-binding protein n=1 Tax=Rhodococcus sp. TaxID=1831 RepID=UPI003BB1990B